MAFDGGHRSFHSQVIHYFGLQSVYVFAVSRISNRLFEDVIRKGLFINVLRKSSLQETVGLPTFRTYGRNVFKIFCSITYLKKYFLNT